MNCSQPSIRPLALLVSMSLPHVAYAQSPQTTEHRIEEIVVTVQQQNQVITEVPVALSAFSNKELEKMNLTDFERIAALTPGFISQQQTDSSASFVIRGVEAAGTGAAAEPTISIFYNGVDSSRSRGAVKELYDIERVEVVKGPQGTLFGRGASTGAIAIHTRKADTQENSGFVESKLGNYNLYSLTGAYNLVVNDELGIRVAGSRRKRDGYVFNLGEPERKLNDDDMAAARFSMRWQPSDSIHLDFIYDHQNDKDYGVSTKSIIAASPGGNTSPFTHAGQNKQLKDQARRQNGYTLLVDWDINQDWRLSSISGHRQLWFDNAFDIDGTTYHAFAGIEYDRQKAISQELRLAYDSQSATITLGASYYRDEASSGFDFVINEQYLLGGFPNVLTPLPELPVAPGVSVPLNEANVSRSYTENKRHSQSVFANLNMDLNAHWTLDAGLRYTWDRATLARSGDAFTLDGIGSFVLPNGFLGNSFGEMHSTDADFNMLSPRVALTYRLNEAVNLYAGMSIGKRAGYPDISIQNPTADSVSFSTKEIGNETLTSYEIGAKGQTSNLYFDLALYSYQYDDFQTVSLDITEGAANAGKAKAWGLEGLISAEFTDWLGGFANYAYIDTEYVNFFDTLNGEPVDLSGNRFRLAPKNTFSVGLDASATLSGSWRWFANTQYAYRSDYFFNNDNLANEQQDGFGLLDVRIGLEDDTRGYKIELFAENALDEQWVRDIGNAGKLFGTSTAIRGNPRFYGVRFRAEFF